MKASEEQLTRPRSIQRPVCDQGFVGSSPAFCICYTVSSASGRHGEIIIILLALVEIRSISKFLAASEVALVLAY